MVEDLGGEIQAQKKALPIEKEIATAMAIKKEYEQDYIKIHTQRIDEKTDKYAANLHELQVKISAIDQKTSKLLRAQQAF